MQASFPSSRKLMKAIGTVVSAYGRIKSRLGLTYIFISHPLPFISILTILETLLTILAI